MIRFEIIVFVFTLLFIIGSLGLQSVWVSLAGVLVSGFLLFFYYLKKRRIVLPQYFGAYILFLLFFLISLVWSKNQELAYTYFLMFLSGGIMHLYFYNIAKEKTVAKGLYYIILTVGIILGILYIFNFLTGSQRVNSYSLIDYSVASRDHHHIGDIWMGIIGLLLPQLFSKKKNKLFLILLLVFGIWFMFMSYSRSAYLSLIAGLIYYIFSVGKRLVNKKLVIALVVISGFLFIFSSLNKPLTGHRTFMITGIAGLVQNPLGVGIGSFGYAANVYTYLNTLFGYANVADNLVLEIVVGLGFLSFPFVYWFFAVMIKLFKDRKLINLEYKVFFLILTVNFMFNHIYLIPATLWMWFCALAISIRTVKS